MKKFICAAIAAITCFGVAMTAGCSRGREGRDGKDGSNVSIYEIYDAVNKERKEQGLEELEFLDFISEYLNYESEELSNITSLKNVMNKSLLSGVSIVSSFSQKTGGLFGGTEKDIGFGSGVIIDLDKEKGDALVVTNCHVVYNNKFPTKFSNDIRLYLYGQDTMGVNFGIDQNYDILYDEDFCINASIVGASLTYDIAVLKVEGSEVLKRSSAIAAKFCDKEYISVGETVYAVGNASGEGTAATKGIISRDSEDIWLDIKETPNNTNDDFKYTVMRTDTAVNGGNSGGGLFNTKGEIVAIVNAKSAEDDVDNMAYALPASSVKRVIKSIVENNLGTSGIKKARIGITTIISDSYAVYNEELSEVEIFELVRVEEVSAASVAGLSGTIKEGDIIKEMAVGSGEGANFVPREGIKVNRSYNVSDILLSVRYGDTLKLTVERSDKLVEVYLVYNNQNYFVTEE